MSKEGFEALVNGYSTLVLNTAARILGDTQKAQDIHQEVFLEIWRRWHRYDGRTNWKAYLYRTTIRKAIASAKRSRAQTFLEQPLEDLPAREKPDAPIRTAELQHKLAHCLAGLPKRQARVFVLSRIEGLKHDMIAELLGCSQKTVRVHLHRAIKRLAHELSGYLEEYGR